MTAPIPATIAEEVYQELIANLSGLHRYLDDESIAIRRLRGRIEQLIKVDAAPGWAARAIFSTLFGNKPDAMSAAKNALRLSRDPRLWASVATNVYMNIAEFGEALDCLVEAAHPHRGLFSRNIGWLIMAGGLRTASGYCEIAKGMGLDIPELPINLPVAIRALDEFDSPNLLDTDLAEMLAVAARVLFERRLMTSDQHNTLMQYDDGTIAYRFPLAVSAPEVSDVMMEVSDQLSKHRTLSVAFGVSFYPFAGAFDKVPVAA